MNVSQEPARRTDPAAFSTFGEFLKYLRRRARLTQEELGRAVGYSREQINRFERNQRVPEVITLASLFVPALHLRQEPELVARFLQLAAEARGETLPPKFEISHTLEHRITALSPSERDAHRAAAEWAELAQGDVIEAARQYGLAARVGAVS
jgi:transcriptional regulator with XRE-family HTH domain